MNAAPPHSRSGGGGIIRGCWGLRGYRSLSIPSSACALRCSIRRRHVRTEGRELRPLLRHADVSDWPNRSRRHLDRAERRCGDASLGSVSLLLDLNGQDTSRALERRLRAYARPQILAIDEVGYLSYDAHAADLLFQVISRRYEQRAIVMTTNLLFKQWDTVFPNASCAVALIDRLTHHAEIIPIEGESYRKREADLTQKKRRATP